MFDFAPDIRRHVIGGSSSTISPVMFEGLLLWLDGADETKITRDESDLVSLWEDKSENGNNASQGTGSAQPTYVAGSLNGLSSLDFDGSSDYMEFDSEMSELECSVYTVGS